MRLFDLTGRVAIVPLRAGGLPYFVPCSRKGRACILLLTHQAARSRVLPGGGEVRRSLGRLASSPQLDVA